MNINLRLMLLLLFSSAVYPQGSAGEKSVYEPVQIIDMPTAGVIPESFFLFRMTAMESGGAAVSFGYAPVKNINIGASYSITRFVGYGAMEFQNLPGFSLRWRVFDETPGIPAFVIGANTQGIGIYDKNAGRHSVNSPGIFLAISKSFRWNPGQIALHGGVNYSFDVAADKRTPNFFLGLEQSLGARCAVTIEYNATRDEPGSYYLAKWGLLSSSFRWSAAKDLTIELQVRDMLGHQKSGGRSFTRYFGLEYITGF